MLKLNKICFLILLAIFLVPLVVSAQTLYSVIVMIDTLVDAVIPVLMAICVAVFLWGVVKFIAAGADMEQKKAAHGYITFGLLGIFVLVAFWGIVQIITTSFGIQTGGTMPRVELGW